MKKYRVAIAGCGPRGRDHALAFLKNSDRFELVAMCDLDEERARALADKCRVQRTYTDVESMLSREKPDVFCFATMPAVRLPLVKLGVKHKVKVIAFEKPMAVSVEEARRIRTLCDSAGIKFIV